MQRLSDAISLAQRVAETGGRRLVLFVDEFQELASPSRVFAGPEVVMKAMRAGLQHADRVATLFAGSVEHMMRDVFASRQRAFFQWGGWHELGPVGQDEWVAGIRSRAERAGLRFTGHGARLVVSLGAGHPRATMLLAKSACRAAVELGSATVDVPEVEASMEEAMAADAPYHQATVESLQETGRHALAVAAAIARGDPPYATGLPAHSVQRAVRAISRKGLLEKTGTRGRGGWRFVDPLLSRYIAEQVR